MTREFIQVLVPPAVAPPRGAEWAANVAIALVRFFSRRPAVEEQDEPRTSEGLLASSKTKGLSWKR